MLVLSRRIAERILIGKNVEIIIADIRENEKGHFVVDIGFQAPKGVKILRKEVYLEDLKRGTKPRNKS